MAHSGTRQVVHPPASFVQPQAQVDIFAEPQLRRETGTDRMPGGPTGSRRGREASADSGTTGASRAPMSSGDRTSSYLSSQPGRPRRVATTLGAASARAGSANCASSGPSQPGCGCTSESQNATNPGRGVAEPGVARCRGPEVTRMNEYGGAVTAGDRGHLGAAGRSVVDDQHRQTGRLRIGPQRGEQAVQQAAPGHVPG